MVQNRSILNCADNSGAKRLMVINIPGRSKQRFAHLGDIMTCVVKLADPNGTIKAKEIVKVVLARTKKEFRRPDGSYIRFSDNAGIVIDKDKNPKGTRILGPVAKELKERGFTKIISMAPEAF